MKFNEWLYNYRKEHALSMQGMADLCKLSKQYISVLEKGINPANKKEFIPSIETIKKIADATNTDLNMLIGLLDPDQSIIINSTKPIPGFEDTFPVETHKIPFVGKIACGEPILSVENFSYYVEVGTDIRADFCVKCSGDSMYNARIYDGDIVFIRKQPDVENGEIAAVAIDDAITLKRIYKGPGYIELRAENPKYKPIVVREKDHKDVRIIGKAVAFQADVV